VPHGLLLVGHPLQDPLRHEHPQPVVEHVAADAELGAEVVVAVLTAEALAQDHHRPALADHRPFVLPRLPSRTDPVAVDNIMCSAYLQVMPHTALVYLLDPDAAHLAHFPDVLTADEIVARIRVLLGTPAA
jgi:hypothetical protein